VIQSADLKDLFDRAVRFCIVGASAALLYFCLLAGMVELLGVPVLMATMIAYPIVTVENYLLNHSWTFKSTELHGAAFPKFIVSAAVGFFINWVIMSAGVKQLAINYLLVQAFSMAVILVWNLVAGSIWIFGSRPRSSDDTF